MGGLFHPLSLYIHHVSAVRGGFIRLAMFTSAHKILCHGGVPFGGVPFSHQARVHDAVQRRGRRFQLPVPRAAGLPHGSSRNSTASGNATLARKSELMCESRVADHNAPDRPACLTCRTDASYGWSVLNVGAVR